jgi:prepilin-type N-terminal cleavage/methylation domain-containing protein
MKRVKSKGFTLMELLVVVILIGLIFSVIFPETKTKYEKYVGSLEAEKIILFLLKKKRESFLYGKEIEIFVKDGILCTDEGERFKPEKGYLQIESSLKFYPLGSTNGGKIYFNFGKITFLIQVKAPFGEISLEEVFNETFASK